MADYNGWKNRQTWNVALWISNDEGLYRVACEFMRNNANAKAPYARFIKHGGLVDMRTPDNISFSGTRLDYGALNDFMRELV